MSRAEIIDKIVKEMACRSYDCISIDARYKILTYYIEMTLRIGEERKRPISEIKPFYKAVKTLQKKYGTEETCKILNCDFRTVYGLIKMK